MAPWPHRVSMEASLISGNGKNGACSHVMTARHHYAPFKRDYQRRNGVDWLVVRDWGKGRWGGAGAREGTVVGYGGGGSGGEGNCRGG